MSTTLTQNKWKTKPLGEIATIERDAIAPEMIPSGTKYVGLENITSEGQFVGVSEVNNGDIASTKFQFSNRHILYGKLRPYLSKIARSHFSGVCSTDILPVLPGDEVDRGFLYHFLRLPEMVGFAASRSIGANLPRLSPQQLAEFDIPLPSLPEQKRIADILDKADTIRRKRREANRLAETTIRSAFHDWFGNPVSNSKKLPTEKLGIVATLDRGRSRNRPRDAAFLYGGPYPFVQTGDVANSNGYIDGYTQTYSEEGLAQSKLWPSGTLCITIAANIAKTAILTFDACFPDSIVGVIPGPKLTTEYIRYWFVGMEKAIDAAATQVAQKNINLELLRELDIQLPPEPMLRRFTNLVKRIRQLKQTNNTTTQALEDLFNSLIQQAFQGGL